MFATCPRRPRHIIKPVLTARGCPPPSGAKRPRAVSAWASCSGPERAGLDNDDMAQADALVRYPLNPEFMSLNLGQGGDDRVLRVVDVDGCERAARIDHP